MSLLCLAALVSAALFSGHVSAQSVVFRPDETFKTFEENQIEGALFYINGRTVHWNGPMPKGMVYDLEKIVLSLAVLKLNDQGVIDLSAKLIDAEGLPRPSGPYADLLTLKDVLTESAGFATPPTKGLPKTQSNQLSDSLLSRFMLSMRVPGKVSSNDPAGWAYLIHLIEEKTGDTIEGALKSLVFDPLGLMAENYAVEVQPLDGEQLPIKIGFSPTAMVKVLTTIVRNRDAQEDPYLNAKTYGNFIVGNDGGYDRLFSLGFSQITRSSTSVLTDDCEPDGLKLAFIPKADTLFGKVEPDGFAQSCQAFQRASAKIATDILPPSANKQTTNLQPSSDLSGTYVALSSTPIWLADRLAIKNFTRRDVKKSSTGYTIIDDGVSYENYAQTKPYVLSPLIAQNAGGLAAANFYFSPYRNGGYMRHDGFNYRKVGSLVHVGTMAQNMPTVLLIILSAALYALKPVSIVSRNMGRVALLGCVLLGLGLYLDFNYWPHAVYGLDMPILATLWRTLLNIGIMLCLSLPFYAYSATRTLQGAYTPLFRLHMAIVGAAALYLLLTLTMLGVVGQFSAY